MQQVVPSVWMIADRESRDLSYIQTGTGETIEVIGPFAYTKEADAEAAANNHSFLPHPLEGERFDVIEVRGMSLIKGILARFDPSGTDVFMLDEGLLPLTPSGASWVDNYTGDERWEPLFLEASPSGKPAWLTAVFEQVSQSLGVDVIELRGDTDVPTMASAARQQITDNVEISVKPDVPTMFGKVDAGATFRVVTRGMAGLARPDLEMVGIQPLFLNDAMALIASWAAYSLDHPLEVGKSLLGRADPVTVMLKIEGTLDPQVLRLVVGSVLYTDPQHSKVLH